jgi:hypothetical protein
MAVIYDTTMQPSKLELLSRWLPRQSWYTGPTNGLRRAGGFRLDDPDGEVGIEFMIVATADAEAYLVPMTYRGAPLAEIDDALIGLSEHGVLGRRWIYDGERDPVLRAQLTALLRGEAVAQAQLESNTVDRSVVVRPVQRRAVAVHINRMLREDDQLLEVAGYVSATWLRSDGSTARGVVATAA